MDIRKKKYLITNSFFDRSFKNFIFKVMFKTNELFIFLRKLTVVDLSKKVFYRLSCSKRKKITFSLSLSLPLSPYLDFLGNRDVERELVCSTRL